MRLSPSTIRVPHTAKSHDTFHYLLCSDLHLDSIHCERDLIKKHFDAVKVKNGKIFIFGDILDVMATYGDRRMMREDIDPMFIARGRSYLDLIIEYAIEFLMPYRDNIFMISKGNHETVIEKYHNTDPISRIIHGLGGNIYQGGYKGWVFFQYKMGKTTNTHRMHYHHGFGGNAARSKGILAVQMEAMRYPDAHTLVRGHTHQKWHDPSTTSERVHETGRIYTSSMDYLQLGSYKNGALSDGGWEVEKNFMPTKMGGWFMEHRVHKLKELHITSTISEAK